MTYVSKGKLSRRAKGAVVVSHCGVRHELTDLQAALWLAGQHAPSSIHHPKQVEVLVKLAALGIAECCDGADNTALFRLLVNCVICPVGRTVTFYWQSNDRRLWRWITKAGLRLTIAELTLLAERGIEPVPALLGKENRQALTEVIYTTDTVSDGILESLMEKSPARDAVVQTVLSLLRKKKIILI